MSKLIPSPVRRCVQALIVTLMPVLVWAAPVAAQQGPPPPDASGICPGIDEDGLLCSARASEFAVALPVSAQPKEVFGDAPSNENRCAMIQK